MSDENNSTTPSLNENSEASMNQDVAPDSSSEYASDLVAKANEAAARLEAANAKLEANLKRQEALQVERMLGGSAKAGGQVPHEETPEEYAAKVLRGDVNGSKE